ncbi:hypothetical protein LG3211_3409 [Lysobacter gummosus]|nr:hypothetical protein LG3211_3409 [Lysobacter gummosus]
MFRFAFVVVAVAGRRELHAAPSNGKGKAEAKQNWQRQRHG